VKEIKTPKRTAETVIPALENADDYQAFEAVVTADYHAETTDRLSRYEHLLWRQTRQIVLTLESLRRRKRAPNRPSFPFSFRRREPGDLSKEIR
jgi:hypothetical protein